MSARDGAYKALRELYVSHQGASAPWDKGCSHCDERMQKVMVVLDAFANTYAHELAEKIRVLDPIEAALAGQDAWRLAADLIDPQKEGQ